MDLIKLINTGIKITRIYQKQDLSIDEEIALENDASHHIAKVLRKTEGNKLIIFNGEGHEYLAHITKIEKRAVFVCIDSACENLTESPFSIHLAQCISQSHKMDLTIQKATELGVQKITPIISERASIKHYVDFFKNKYSHWQRIIISACEQSGRTRLSELSEPVLLEKFAPNTESCIVLSPEANRTIRSLEKSAINHITLLVGPEGGFSANELQILNDKKFTPIRLGPRILRTEIAGIVAISILQYLFGDLGA